MTREAFDRVASDTGVGRYLVRQIVGLRGGWTWCGSDEGRGTWFWVSLPSLG